MIVDLNSKVDFNTKPYDVQRNGIAIYTLSGKGKHDYVDNNHFNHHYLNKYPKEILAMIDNYAEMKDEMNNNPNPYPVKEQKLTEKSNEKPILKQIKKEGESVKEISQEKTNKKKNETNQAQSKPASNTFKHFSQQIENCATRPGNEKYQTELYKKELEKIKKQSRFNTKINSTK